MKKEISQLATVRLTRPQRKVIAELIPKLQSELRLESASERSLALDVQMLQQIQREANEAISKAETGSKRNSLRNIVERVVQAIKHSADIDSTTAPARLYQFKISLIYTDPPVWRRIQVADCTLDELHDHIQSAMGWTDSHLHEFVINKIRYGDPDLLAGGFTEFDCEDSTTTLISDLVSDRARRFRFNYIYDFGDDWEHEILFEKFVQPEPRRKYPCCVEGARACPPEDVGGVYGYAELVDAMADRKHERHRDFLEWCGRFDPAAFDLRKATKEMQRGLPDWRE